MTLSSDVLCIRQFSSTLTSHVPDAQHYDVFTFPRESSWFRLLETHVFANVKDIVVYVASTTDNRDHVTLPLIRHRLTVLGGSCLSALQNYYTPDYRPLCTSRSATEHIGALVDAIAAAESPDIIRLSPLDPEGPETEALRSALSASGFAAESRHATVNWTHDVEGNYEQYILQRPKRVQNTLKRRARRLTGLKDISIEIYDGRTDLQRLQNWYDEVYSRSWKVAEPYPEFIPALIQQTADAGTLRLGFVILAGQPIAVHFWIVRDGCAFIYKLAHDKAFDKLSPGTVLMADMLRQVIDSDGVKRIDFLTGDDAYKRDWMSQRRVKIEIRAYNRRRFWGVLALVSELYVKPFVKQLRNRVCQALDGRKRAVD